MGVWMCRVSKDACLGGWLVAVVRRVGVARDGTYTAGRYGAGTAIKLFDACNVARAGVRRVNSGADSEGVLALFGESGAAVVHE